MGNRLSWPPLRSDLVGALCITVVVVSMITGRWPGVLVFALAGAIFCGISPRMKGRFGFRGGGGTEIGGEFVHPAEGLNPEQLQLPPAGDPYRLLEKSSKEPAED
jgi:hypothetical protein